MARITLRQLLDHAAENDYGLPAYNINNMEQGLAIMEAAEAVNAPVIIQASRGARSYANDIMLARLIDALVEGFYARVRDDRLIGPIFADRIADWGPHLAQMKLFWSSVALSTGVYQGRPMPKHLPLPVDARHFDRWLELFEATAADVCPPAAAAHFIERARRIAESFVAIEQMIKG